MPTEIRMPQLGESVHEGTIGRWLKRPGEAVAKYEPLVEIITDKVNVEMPSPFAGVLQKILIEEGQTVPAGTAIALIDEAAATRGTAAAGAGAPAAQAQQGRQQGTPTSAASPPLPVGAAAGQARAALVDGERSGGPVATRARDQRLSPLVRRLVEEHHIAPEELEAIDRSGTGGRITKDDVLRYLETRGRATPAVRAQSAPAAASAPPTRAVGPVPATGATAAPAAPPRATGDQLHPLSALRRTIAERMAKSKREIPHAYGVIEVDVTTLVRHREAHKAVWQAREGVNISVTAFVLRAAARALRAYPAVNSTFTPEGIVYKQAVHIGVGVAIPDGLIVPVVKDADQRSVVGLAREVEALVGRARQGKLTLDDVSGGTFTLTNPGVFGSIFSMPIINHPQAAILSADAIVRRPVVRGDGIAIRDVMHLGLAFDHRVFDGAVAMQFLNHIKQQVEEFAPVGDSPEF